MPVCMQFTFPGHTTEHYDAVMERIGWFENPAEGALAHLAGQTDAGLHVVDVWESPEHFQRFFETRLGPALDAAGIEGQPQVTQIPIHSAWKTADEPAAA